MKWFVDAMLALVLAVGISVGGIAWQKDLATVHNGAWRTVVLAGDRDAGVYTRAFLAVFGLGATARTESVYYSLIAVDGAPVRADCTYRIEGGELDAGWWSITAYGRNDLLIDNPADRYSVHSGQVDGDWVVWVSPESRDGLWLPVGPTARSWAATFMGWSHEFDLLLRLYAPSDAYLDDPATAPLPRVVLESCP